MNLVTPTAPTPYRKDGSLLATISGQRAKTGLLSVLSRVWLVWCLAELGEFATGLCDGQVRLAESSSSKDPFQLMLACLAAGRLHLQTGDTARAIEFLERCRQAQRLGNFEVWSASISSTVGYAYLLGGRLDEAVALLTEAVEQASSTKSMFGHSLRLAYLGEAVLLMGRTEEALHHARSALEVSRAQRSGGMRRMSSGSLPRSPHTRSPSTSRPPPLLIALRSVSPRGWGCDPSWLSATSGWASWAGGSAA